MYTVLFFIICFFFFVSFFYIDAFYDWFLYGLGFIDILESLGIDSYAALFCDFLWFLYIMAFSFFASLYAYFLL